MARSLALGLSLSLVLLLSLGFLLTLLSPSRPMTIEDCHWFLNAKSGVLGIPFLGVGEVVNLFA